MNLREQTHDSISKGDYECLICLERITSKSRVWSCKACFRAFDLKCIRNCVSKAKRDTKAFRCPHCMIDQSQSKLSYRCWCRKVCLEDVKSSKIEADIPHSCGQPCGARRKCPHPCPLTCHAGPHQDPVECMYMVPKAKCFCGRHSKPEVCSQLVSGRYSCGEKCKRRHKGCGHRCLKDCAKHGVNGDCGPCEKTIRVQCYCGKTKTSTPCHTIAEQFRRSAKCHRGQRMPTVVISCGIECGDLLDCGKHRCQKRCHDKSKEKSHVCPFKPFENETCFCGKTLLHRSDCTDPRVPCENQCAKILDCGHVCRETCHDGECSPCLEVIEDVSCRCRLSKMDALCSERKISSPLCDKRCTATLSCGRHRCNKPCCEANPKSNGKQITRGNRPSADATSSHSPRDDVASTLGIHECLNICGRLLGCKIHTCILACHTGPCPPCLAASFDEWVCPCGSTRIEPPIRCGTRMPRCFKKCHRTQPCGHEATHPCHDDAIQCSPCVELVVKRCRCGKTDVKTRCTDNNPRCKQRCEKPLPCGHLCQNICCEDDHTTLECNNRCMSVYQSCGHSHMEPCHYPRPCPEECERILMAECQCGALRAQYSCGEDLEISCNETCLRLAYPEILLRAYEEERNWISGVESQITDFVSRNDRKTIWFQPMAHRHRKLTHCLLEKYGISSESIDYGKMRSVCGRRTENTKLCKYTLKNAPRKTPVIEYLMKNEKQTSYKAPVIEYDMVQKDSKDQSDQPADTADADNDAIEIHENSEPEEQFLAPTKVATGNVLLAGDTKKSRGTNPFAALD